MTSRSVRCSLTLPMEESIDGGPWQPVSDVHLLDHGWNIIPLWWLVFAAVAQMCFGLSIALNGQMIGVGIVAVGLGLFIRGILW